MYKDEASTRHNPQQKHMVRCGPFLDSSSFKARFNIHQGLK